LLDILEGGRSGQDSCSVPLSGFHLFYVLYFNPAGGCGHNVFGICYFIPGGFLVGCQSPPKDESTKLIKILLASLAALF
jgi:hypothetical protein